MFLRSGPEIYLGRISDPWRKAGRSSGGWNKWSTQSMCGISVLYVACKCTGTVWPDGVVLSCFPFPRRDRGVPVDVNGGSHKTLTCNSGSNLHLWWVKQRSSAVDELMLCRFWKMRWELESCAPRGRWVAVAADGSGSSDFPLFWAQMMLINGAKRQPSSCFVFRVIEI